MEVEVLEDVSGDAEEVHECYQSYKDLKSVHCMAGQDLLEYITEWENVYARACERGLELNERWKAFDLLDTANMEQVDKNMVLDGLDMRIEDDKKTLFQQVKINMKKIYMKKSHQLDRKPEIQNTVTEWEKREGQRQEDHCRTEDDEEHDWNEEFPQNIQSEDEDNCGAPSSAPKEKTPGESKPELDRMTLHAHQEEMKEEKYDVSVKISTDTEEDLSDLEDFILSEKNTNNSKSKRKHIDIPFNSIEKHKCPKCPLSLSTRSNLNHHMKVIHLGIKLHCNMCDYKAHRKRALERHKQTQHGQFKCDECEFVSTDKKNI